MDILKESIAFRNLIRKDIIELLNEYKYELIFDSSLEDQKISKNWVFKLIFKGDKVIEIYNDDYRDYIEYFNVSMNGKEIFHVKINEFETLAEALKVLNSKILTLLQ